MPRTRADLLLVQRGLAESREQAQRLIMAGRAKVGTRTLVKPAEMLDDDCIVELSEPERYVSRGGYKLEGALDTFSIDVADLACLDLGASTGGFTDCLLQRGARSVLCIDVGRAQLHDRLRRDQRVTLFEGTNARDLPELPLIDFFVADLSFISLRRVLPSLAARVEPRTPGVVLLKPQFEAGPENVSRGGIVRDEAVRTRVLAEFVEWAQGEDWLVLGTMNSPVAGTKGNVEFLVWLSSPDGEHNAAAD